MFFFEVLLGVFLGFLCGLIPNLHINLLGYLFSLFGIFILFKNHFYFFFSFCVSQSLTSIIPSFLFFTQTKDTLLSPFLGRFLKPPMLQEAIKLSFLGFLLGSFFSFLFLPFFYLLFIFFSDFYFLIFVVLFLVLLFLIFQEKNNYMRFVVFSIVVFSGVLGVVTLKFNFFFKEPLIPCIFGLFVFPNIILLIFSKDEFVYLQGAKETKPISLKEILSCSFLGCIFSSTVALFPSLSPGLSMCFASFFLNEKSYKKNIVIFSSIFSSVLLLYFFMSVVFNKHRVGFLALLFENNIFPNMCFLDLVFLGFTFLLVVGLCVFLMYFFLETIISFLKRFDMKNILVFVSFFTFFLIYFFCGLNGFFLLGVSTAIGFLPIVYNKNKMVLMSYLIIPTILFFI